MSIKRYSGTGLIDITSRKRWNGSAWVDLTIGKRWNGAAWVDLWSASSGSSGSSGASSGSGVLFSDLKSTVSSPTVHYSCEYEVTNSGVTLSFKGWLGSTGSTLGNGIKLTVFARMNGGAWVSTVIKATNTAWSGTRKHSASLSVSGKASGKTKIELYVTRSGSSYSGSAGSIGSAKKPKIFYFNS